MELAASSARLCLGGLSLGRRAAAGGMARRQAPHPAPGQMGRPPGLTPQRCHSSQPHEPLLAPDPPPRTDQINPRPPLGPASLARRCPCGGPSSSGAMYIEDWDSFYVQAEELWRKDPIKTRYCIKYRHTEGKLVLKVTDDVVVSAFRGRSRRSGRGSRAAPPPDHQPRRAALRCTAKPRGPRPRPRRRATRSSQTPSPPSA